MMIRESRLYLPVQRHLQSDFEVKGEVKIGSKVVDIYAVSKTGTDSLAVELKVKDWKRALRQAATYQVFADLSFVALHRSQVSCALRHSELFNELGVGLLSIKRDVRVEIPSRQSDCVNKLVVDQVRQQLFSGEERLNRGAY